MSWLGALPTAGGAATAGGVMENVSLFDDAAWSAVGVLGWALVTLLALAASALCSGMETGYYTFNRTRLTILAGRHPGDLGARVLRGQMDRPQSVITTLLVSNNLVGYLAATGLAAIFHAVGLTDTATAVLNVLVLTPLLLVLGESLPKEVFRVHADVLTRRFAPVLRAAELLFTIVPLVPLVRLVALVPGRLFGAGDTVLEASERDQVAALIKEGAGDRGLSASQATMVDRALVFSRATVEDEMAPWSGVRPIHADWDRPRLMQHLAAEDHTRVPVVDRRGAVVGVIATIDAYLRPEATIAQLQTPPVRLPPAMTVREALGRLLPAGGGLAIVERDGRPLGVVTAKDLIEPLTGEIADW